ncbi:uncharacterized protein LOC113551031 [Rhopalosiphum maidis]|uniref:uncharacterized protein LOC113551031 n=1 Tax=Rhopalosiphum maidis TaxID=43146 RepID=UPI000EFEEB9E|nr:uncharacterized protein LOC113551031 [Rhopalosiphum maidis]
MNILSTLFVIMFSFTQVKNEHILLEASDCKTKCPIRRQTIRSYPPGTLLFVGDECVCGKAQETIYEYVPAVQPVGNVAIPVGLKPKKIEPQSDNRVMGNYGSLVFSANIEILNLLRITNDDARAGCDKKESNPSNDRLISTTNKPTAEDNTPTTIPVLKNVSSTTNKKHSYTANYTDENVLMLTKSTLENWMITTIKESTPESNVTNNSSEVLTSIDIQIQTSTVRSKQKEDPKVFTTEAHNVIFKQPNTHNNSNIMIIDSYSNKKSDLEMLIRITDSFNLNN